MKGRVFLVAILSAVFSFQVSASFLLKGGALLTGTTVKSPYKKATTFSGHGFHLQLAHPLGKGFQGVLMGHTYFGKTKDSHFSWNDRYFSENETFRYMGVGFLFRYTIKDSLSIPGLSNKYNLYVGGAPMWSLQTTFFSTPANHKLTITSSGGIMVTGLEEITVKGSYPVYVELSYYEQTPKKASLVHIPKRTRTTILQTVPAKAPKTHVVGLSFGITFF